MKKIYFVLSYTGTWLAKIIRQYTKKEYSHISISLDENLQRMYSFGRHHPYIFFWGGFVHESVHYGTFKRFSKTKAAIYEMEVTEEQYAKMADEIAAFKKQKMLYHFNILGLFGVAFQKRRIKQNYYYCAEFVRYLLENAGVLQQPLPEVIKPEDFQKIPGIKLVYEGNLKVYQSRKDEQRKEKRRKRKQKDNGIS